MFFIVLGRLFVSWMEIIWIFYNARLDCRQLASWNKHKVSRGENERNRAKGNSARLAVLSVHLSPPPGCLSRCLMVYYGKLKGFQVEIQTGFESTAAVDFLRRTTVQIVTHISLFWSLMAHNVLFISASLNQVEGPQRRFKLKKKKKKDQIQLCNVHQMMAALLVDTHSL